MVNIFQVPDQGQALFGAGLGGFLNGNPIGEQENRPVLGGLARNGLSLRNQAGLGLLNSSASPLLKSVQQQAKPEFLSQKDEDEKKDKDRVELSNFAEEAVNKAVENARKSPRIGETNQIIVSEDGRFEASIDLRRRADGSFDLDLAVSFGQSSMQQLNGSRSLALPESPENLELDQNPASLRYNSLQASSERYTSYEQLLQTRDFEARIFFEESKSVALKAEQAYGGESGEQVLSVAKEVAHEYTLNISISGKDLDSFNAAAEDLTQLDDSGTLAGFLDGVRGVLQADSSNLDSFLEATRGLIDLAREHVGSKLNNFFANMNENYGGMLEEMGFDPDYLQNVGEDVNKDLNTFFDLSNKMLGGMASGNEVEDKTDVETSELNMLEQSLERVKEQRKEIMEGKEKNPYEQLSDSFNKPNTKIFEA